ncbi:Gypsy retrotransposon integrase-like protein 1, partial [Conglomerata obtusa]
GPNINTKNLVIKREAPNELWQLDLIGYLRGSDGKNRYILTAIDHYGKWLEICVVENKKG